MILTSLASAQPASRVTLSAMNLEVELPAGWILDPNPGEWSLDEALRPAGANVFWPTIEVMDGNGTCDQVLEHWRGGKPLEPRLSIIPPAYHTMVAYREKNPTAVNYVHTCIGAGRETLHVRLRFVPTEDNSAVTAVLAAIARAYESRPGKTPIAAEPPPPPGGEQRLAATGLVVTLPAGWKASREWAGEQPVDMLAAGRESIFITRFEGSTCVQLIKTSEEKQNKPASPRPDFAPASFHGRALVEPTSTGGVRYTFCRDSGTRGIYVILTNFADRASPELVGTLHSVARAIDDVAPATNTTVATSGSRTYLAGSGLTVHVPAGWFAERAVRRDVTGDSIVGPSELVLLVRTDRGANCRAFLDKYASRPGRSLRPLPAFAPASAFPEAVVSSEKGKDVYGMCISKPPGMYVIEAYVPPGATATDELTSLLQSIGEAIHSPTTASSLSGSTSAGSTYTSYEPTSRSSRSPQVNRLVYEVRGAMFRPPSDAMSGGYGFAGGLSRLNLGDPEDGMTMATELVVGGGYATNAGATADVRLGIGGALSAGSNSRIGVLVGVGLDGIGIGQDEGDPTKLVLPFDKLFYATAALRTALGDSMALQLSGSYRSRSDVTEYLGEARLFMKGRSWSALAFYEDLELASIIGGGLAFGM